MSNAFTLELWSRLGKRSTPVPSWPDVERVLHSLDGETRNTLFLGNPESTAGLIVGGGPERFMVWVQQWDLTGEELSIDTATDRHAPSGLVRFTLDNGELGEYPLSITVDLESAIRAARTFFERGELDDNLTWEHQGRAPGGPDRRGF